MRSLLFASLLLLPAVALADDDHCRYQADRNMDLDLRGVRGVSFTVNSHALRVASGGAGKATIRGKACASDKDALDDLVVTQRREGDTLYVELANKHDGWSGFGSHYSDLKVDATVPAGTPVSVHVGSGDAVVRGVTLEEGTVGSGDLEAFDVKGPVRGHVGSGELKLEGSGPLDIGAVGSGSFSARRVQGAVRIDAVRSGEAKLTDVGGDVVVDSIGSGELEVDGVRGNLTVRRKGSGDVDHHGVTGRVEVPND